MLTVSKDSLSGIVGNALERMAFVFVEDSEAEPIDVIRRSCAFANIELRGSRSFRILVAGTGGMVTEIASGMMGVDEDAVDANEIGYATVAEMANVFGGELVQELSRQGHSLMIGLPQEAGADDAGRFGDDARQHGVLSVVHSDCGEMVVAVIAD